ncbi:uncharacterized protein LOC135097489 [Scylla paramamosain]|uniref:uncharacterized protein LOC135097489 n=1 Tax=Scylla paramamosain TaxID=85552 RepID=UPI003082949C
MATALFPFSLQQSGEFPKHLYEELLSTISRGDNVQAVSSLLCKGTPIEPLGGRSVLRLAVTTDRARTVSLLLASSASLPASLLQEAWQSPDVTHRVLASLTTAYCCRLRAEKRHLEKISGALVEGINYLVETIEGNAPWQAVRRWEKETDRTALNDLLVNATASNCSEIAAFLQIAEDWPFSTGTSAASALHAPLEAGHQEIAELLLSPHMLDTHGRLLVQMMTDEE